MPKNFSCGWAIRASAERHDPGVFCCSVYSTCAGSGAMRSLVAVCLKFVFGVFRHPGLIGRGPPVDREIVGYAGRCPLLSVRRRHPTRRFQPPSPTATATAPRGTGTNARRLRVSFVQLLLGLWLVGIASGSGCRAWLSHSCTGSRRAGCVDDSPSLAEAAREGRGSDGFQTLVARSAVEPLTVGLLRPRILIGSDEKGRLSSAELLAILVHECTHIKRNDCCYHSFPGSRKRSSGSCRGLPRSA
jgi:hypothetical protein